MENDLHTLASGHAASKSSGFSGTPRRGRGTPLARELSQLLTPQPESTYLFRVSGYSWSEQGIVDGDIAVVDRSRKPEATDLVISWRDSGFAIAKQYQLDGEDETLGVVTAVIHPLQ
jgi:hypothetical protein